MLQSSQSMYLGHLTLIKVSLECYTVGWALIKKEKNKWFFFFGSDDSCNDNLVNGVKPDNPVLLMCFGFVMSLRLTYNHFVLSGVPLFLNQGFLSWFV